MRKIKCRVWDKHKDRMVEPRLILNIHFDRRNQEPNQVVYLEKYMDPRREISSFDKVYCNEFVLMQCIGIEDSSSNEIYEGDILKISDGVHTTFEEVYFGIDRGGNYPAYTITNLEWKFSANPFSELLDSTTDYEFVVVGNIHENPEITGGKRK